MNAGDVHQIVSETIWTILIAAGPVLLVALVIGFGVALFQALTSVQEMTLTFVPKVGAILITVVLTLSFIFQTLMKLSDQIFHLISGGLG